jgi:hypothetical protein
VPLIIGSGGLGVALAFFEFNGRPFIIALENGFYFLLRSKLYLWDNQRRDKSKATAEQPMATRRGGELYVPHLSESRLHELSWSLDIKEKIAAGIASDSDRDSVAPEASLVAPIRTSRGALVR